jgi:glucose/arabinose dehydrogenase
MLKLIFPALIALATPALSQTNAGNQPGATARPFTVTPVARFDEPTKLAFLPGGWMLVTEKPGKLWMVSPDGKVKRQVSGVPPVEYSQQGGLLGIFLAPSFARDGGVYLTYSEPGPGGSGLALAHATLDRKAARVNGLHVIWRQLPRGEGGQFGGYVAFAPDGKSLFLTSGERQRFTPAQDPNDALGKILHLTLDGKPAPDNPMAGKTGAATVPVFDPPADTEAVKAAKAHPGRTSSPNVTPAETWSTGHRNSYGLAFDSAGRLWETEFGPRGGDELNLIEKGGNYGWPVVSYGMNYDGVPIPSPKTHPEFKLPAIYWNPVISPAGLAFYEGRMFPAWRGSALIGGLSSESLTRVAFDGANARAAERWSIGHRVRDVVVNPDDGAVWLVEDGSEGQLLRLTAK